MSQSLMFSILALMALSPVASPAAAQSRDQTAVNRAVDLGVEHLIASQQLDGTWNHGARPRSGCTALILYTLLKSGVDPRRPAVALAAAHLERAQLPVTTYDAALMLMALATHDRKRHRAQIQDLADLLISWQERGGWGYPGSHADSMADWQDLSNTQYAALGLWTGARAGARVPARTWTELVSATLSHRKQEGGFGYRVGGGQSTGSMTAAAVAILAICRDMLRLDEKRNKKRQESALYTGIEGGMAWLGRHFSVNQNPGAGRWQLGYYLYGLERAGALVPTEEIGGRDWYAEGARALVAGQASPGHFGKLLGAGFPDTCFALLFLRKATAPVTGVAPRVGGREVSLSAKASPVGLTASGDRPLSLWITSFAHDVRSRFEWPGEQGKGPRVERVLWLVDGIEMGRVDGDPSRPTGHARYPMQCELEEPGLHEVRAEVHLISPATRDSAGRSLPPALKILHSGKLTVTVRNSCPEWMLENAYDRTVNLLVGRVRAVRASSSSSGHPPQLAADNLQGTSWLADPADEQPTLVIELERAIEANRIVVGHARTQPLRQGALARALEVQVKVNGTKTYRLKMHSDERRKGRLELPGIRKIRQLELSIPWRVPGARGQRSVGLAEVELQFER